MGKRSGRGGAEWATKSMLHPEAERTVGAEPPMGPTVHANALCVDSCLLAFEVYGGKFHANQFCEIVSGVVFLINRSY